MKVILMFDDEVMPPAKAFKLHRLAMAQAAINVYDDGVVDIIKSRYTNPGKNATDQQLVALLRSLDGFQVEG